MKRQKLCPSSPLGIGLAILLLTVLSLLALGVLVSLFGPSGTPV